MRFHRRRTFAFAALGTFVFLSLLLMSNGIGQTRVSSPADLIQFLTYQSGRPRSALPDTLREAGKDNVDYWTNFSAAKSLADLGASAIPEIERALRHLENSGERSRFARNAGWLLLAYARIKGPDAFPRLSELIGARTLAFLRPSVDRSLALSLGLTSYVSGFSERYFVAGVRAFRSFRNPEPRDALDQFIRAWERDDRSLLEGTLGPNATTALESLLRGRSWADLRNELWRAKVDDGVAVGYRFETSEPWSEPEVTLEGIFDPYRERLRYPVDPEPSTRFTSASGSDCGNERVKFRQTPRSGRFEPVMYLINNTDLGELLRLIGSCAAQPSRRP
jgi:hypothetical protein